MTVIEQLEKDLGRTQSAIACEAEEQKCNIEEFIMRQAEHSRRIASLELEALDKIKALEILKTAA